MQSTGLIGIALVATGLGFYPSIAKADATTWSTSAVTCVPVRQSGLSITGGAVTAKPGTSVTLSCNIAPLAGAFDTIRITCKGGSEVVSTSNNDPARENLTQTGLAWADFIEVEGNWC